MTDVMQETVSQMNVKVKDWHAEQGRFLFFAGAPSLHYLVPKLKTQIRKQEVKKRQNKKYAKTIFLQQPFLFFYSSCNPVNT